MCNDCYDNDTQQANAQLIVTAVNSHEANVKRIEELEKHLSIMIDLTVSYANKLNVSGDYIDQVIHARTALNY